MTINNIYKYLEKVIGLDIGSVGKNNIDNAIKSLMTELDITSVDLLESELTRSTAVQRKFFENIIVPETWFFRDDKPFEYLRKWIIDSKFLATKDVLNVLSVPCSTGEEPYSIAITLLESGIPPERISIDAIDLSEEAIIKAQKGEFGHSSFRNKSNNIQTSYFENIDNNKYKIKKDLRQMINFRQDNILHLWTIKPGKKYQVIFFRNLLIYLNKDAREKTLRKIRDLMKEDSVLFTGHTETSYFMQNGFRTVKYPHSFALKLAGQKPDPVIDKKTSGESKLISANVNQKRNKSNGIIKEVQKDEHAEKDKKENVIKLSEIKEYADKGDFHKAMKYCKSFIENNKTDPDGYYYLGLIYEATGKINEAIDLYNKSLYLKPAHQDALLHLGLLYENIGNMKEAQKLKERLKRLNAKMNNNEMI